MQPLSTLGNYLSSFDIHSSSVLPPQVRTFRHSVNFSAHCWHKWDNMSPIQRLFCRNAVHEDRL